MNGPTRSSGYTNLSSTSSGKFIPQIWSGKLVEKFYDATVFGEIANTDYEGEIKNQGDTVHIRTTPTLTIRDYEIGGSLNYENPTNPAVELQIDKGKYFAFQVDDVDEYQADIDIMDDWAGDGGEQMKIAVDTEILAYVPTGVSADNAGAAAGVKSGGYNLGASGSWVSLTKANILDYLVDLGSVLDEQNVPETGRWSIIRNGRVGMIDRFMIYMSNNLDVTLDGSTNVTNIIAGHKVGLTFAAQMTKMETLPNPNSFGQLVRGLNIYGRKVVEGKYLTHLYAAKG